MSAVPFAERARTAVQHARSTADRLPEGFDLEFDHRLVEEVVLRHLSGQACERDFRAERDPIYEMSNPDEREARFRALHAGWFLRLRLGWPVQQALAEQPVLVRRTRGCRVLQARTRRDEGADLDLGSRRGAAIDASPATAVRAEDPRIVLRLRPTTLLDATSGIALLRRELLHLADMLDPQFGYEPALPPSEVGPAYDALLVERYRVLWDTYVEGRLARLGLGEPGERERRLAQFAASFTMLGPSLEASFASWFDRNGHRHAELVEFARNPGGSPHANRCPICHFPAPHLHQIGMHGLQSETLRHLRAEHPEWDPVQGLCLQCADLWAARSEA